ncbi:MAG: response regulator [Anaerolineales bacterium]|nr:response regulator [Anaerolineales bacterium]
MCAKILIVEDQLEMLQLLGITLETDGHTIVVAQDVETAQEKIAQSPPDLVILDIMLPGISGMELLKAIRSNPQVQHLPVIVVSALSSVEDKIAGLEAGADEYLTKPVDAREVVVRVASLLERTKRMQMAVPAAQAVRGQVLAFLGVKGGVGSTTVAMNVSGALIQMGNSVVAVELGASFLSFSHYLGLPPHGQATDLMVSDADQFNHAALDSALMKHSSGLRLLCLAPELGQIQDLKPESVIFLIEALVQAAEFAVVDLSPRIDAVNQAVLGHSDKVVIVLEPTPMCLDASRVVVTYVRQWASSASSISCVLVNRSGIAASLSAPDIQKELGVPVLGSIPQAGDVLASFYQRGQILLHELREHAVANAVKSITSSLVASG